MKCEFGAGKDGWPESKLGPAPTDEASQNRLIDGLQDWSQTHPMARPLCCSFLPSLYTRIIHLFTHLLQLLVQDRKTEIYQGYVARGPESADLAEVFRFMSILLVHSVSTLTHSSTFVVLLIYVQSQIHINYIQYQSYSSSYSNCLCSQFNIHLFHAR